MEINMKINEMRQLIYDNVPTEEFKTVLLLEFLYYCTNGIY